MHALPSGRRFAAPLGVGMGVEPSAAMGRIARRRGIVVVRGAAEALPFANGAFEGALFVTTICFVDDLAASLREAHRVLRPGGAILVGFVDRESPLGHEYANRKAENPFYRTATFYSAGELAGSMEREGFHGFAYAQTIFHPLDQIRDVEPTTEGHGRGSFVVMRAIKPGTARLSATADSP
ncbi:MAG TPA: class I SAM-dependent methyltransferase [Thermoplasmata archaeon]|nr:class I SAM-dependent methyltransferase [Thermoplasmata archaeon]